MSSRHDIPAIVTALNVNGLGVARALGRNGVQVISIHDNNSDPETRSCYIDEHWLREDSLTELLLHQGPKFASPPVLFPITDDSVASIADEIDELRRYYRISMPDQSLVRQLLDKTAFDRMARDLDLPVPRTWTVESSEQLAAVAEEIPYPCILKPPEKSAALDAGAYILDDAKALRAKYEELRTVQSRFVVQQFVPGGDREVFFCLQACGTDHEPLASFTGRKLRQWRPQRGGTASCEPVTEPRLAELTADFFRRVGMVGVCSMEFKRDPRDGTFYMIEPTVCRTDWQNGLADANGMPIAYFAYCDAISAPMPHPRKPRLARRWVCFGTDRLAAHHYRQLGELGRLRWLWSIRPMVHGAYFAFDDIRPFLSILRATCRRAWQKLLGSRSAGDAA